MELLAGCADVEAQGERELQVVPDALQRGWQPGQQAWGSQAEVWEFLPIGSE